MSMVNKTAFDIISECSLTDGYNTNSMFDSDVDVELNTLYKDIAKAIDGNAIVYTPASIPVLQVDSEDDHPFVVELDMLAKYMQTNSIVDIEQGVKDIAEANHIDASNLYVLIESEDEVREYLEEAKKIRKATGSKKKIAGTINTASILNKLKTKGIKIAKKKPSKKVIAKSKSTK